MLLSVPAVVAYVAWRDRRVGRWIRAMRGEEHGPWSVVFSPAAADVPSLLYAGDGRKPLGWHLVSSRSEDYRSPPVAVAVARIPAG